MATTKIDPTQQNQAEADAAGISLADYEALLEKYPPVYTQNSQGGQYGMSAGGSYGQNPALGQILQTLQLINQQKQQQAATAASAPGAAGSVASQSYLSPQASQAPQTNPTMANNPTTSSTTGQPQISDQQAIQYFINNGGYTSVDPQTAQAYFSAQNPNFGQSGVDSQKAINWYIQQGGNPQIDAASAIHYYEQTHPDELQKGIANAALTPEQRANQQMATIDPASETLRTAVSQSYLTPLQQSASGGPNAAQLQSYLDTYKQLDPAGYAQRQAQQQQVADYVTQITGQAPTSAADALAKYQQLDPAGYASMTSLGSSEDASLKQATDQLALGSQLDPVTARQVEQQTRMGQAARGNVYGTPQMVEEAMTTGQAGLALQQQRQAAAQAAQGNMQSYLTSGATPGAVGNQMYQQGVTNRANALGLQQGYLASGQTLGDTALNLYNQNQANLRANQQGALSYLSSGQTPYQAGAGYLSGAEATAAGAAQGGPVYNPSALGAGQAGTSQQAPQYGLDVGSQSQNYFNSLQNQYASGAAGGATKNKTVSAATGAASGALAGATAGSVVPVYGTAIGAVVGGVAGGLGGYYS